MPNEKMDAAALEAHESLSELMEGFSDEQTEAVMSLVGWLKSWRGSAGYKRLCKLLFEVFGF